MHLFRTIARPLSLMALLALLAPGWAECRPSAVASTHEGMSCCLKTDSTQGKLDSGCCTIRRAPEPQQIPATTVTTPTAPIPADAPAEASVAVIADLSVAPGTIPLNSGPSGPPLYLRLSVIRR